MNEVRISIDDETKSFQPEEYLTSGSKYRIVIPGAASTVGAGDLIVTVPDGYVGELPRSMRIDLPVVAARSTLAASGTDCVGELKTNTDVLQVLAQKYPLQTMTFDAVIHSTTYAENVAVGKIKIRLCEVASGEPSGAATLYKGDKGDTISITSVEKTGEDIDGNWIYVATFSDYTTKEFVVPKGPKGQDALTTYLKEINTEKTYHECVLVKVGNQWVLSINQTAVIPEKNISEATIAANDYMKKAGWFANGKPDETDPTVIVVNGALQFKTAAETAKTAAETAQTAAETAQTAAETAQTAAETAQDVAEDAKDDAVAAKTAAEAARASCDTTASQIPAATAAAVAAVNAAKGSVAEQTGALWEIETAKTAAVQSVDSAKGDDGSQAGHTKSGALGAIVEAKEAAISRIGQQTDVVTKGQNETITGLKTFTGGMIAPGVACGNIVTATESGSHTVTVQVHASGSYFVLLFVKNNSSSATNISIDNANIYGYTVDGNGTAIGCTALKNASYNSDTGIYSISFTISSSVNYTYHAIPVKVA